MKSNTQLVIIDTDKDIKKIINCDIILWQNNKFVEKDNNFIEISLNNNSFVRNQKKILCKVLNKYYVQLSKSFIIKIYLMKSLI